MANLPIKWFKMNIFNRKQYLVYPRKCQRTHNCSRAWHVYANEPIRTSVDKRQIIHVPGPSVIYCGKTLLALWDDDMWINSYISTRFFYILLLFKLLLSKITSCAHNSTWKSWCWRALKLILMWNPVCQ